MPALPISLRRTLRGLARRPAFGLLVVATLAIGIGANLGIFGYMTYFTRPGLDAPEPRQVVWVDSVGPQQPYGWPAYGDWRRIVEATGETLEEHAGYRILNASMAPADGPTRVPFHAWGFAVSGDYFHLFGARPQHGRLLSVADDRPGAAPVVVLSDATWRRRFAADPGVVGRAVRFDGRHDYTVVGVAERGFQGQGFALGVYVPLATAEPLLGNLDAPIAAVARLADGVGVEAAQSSLDALAAALDAEDRAAADHETAATELATAPRRFRVERAVDRSGWEGSEQQTHVRLLMAAVGLLLLLACANVANLMLARAAERRRELAIANALGAGRRRLAGELLAESLLLATAGGLAGVALGRALLSIVEGYLVSGTPIGFGDWAAGSRLSTDGGLVALFLVALVAGTALAATLGPAWRLWRSDPAAALRAGSATGGGRPSRLRPALVVTQVALSALLLVTAALLARSLAATHGTDPGFAVDGLTVAALYAPRAADPDEPAALQAVRYDDLAERARELPGVESVGYVQRLPLTGFTSTVAALPDAGAAEAVDYEIVGPGAFATLGVPLLRGRDFDRRDAGEEARTVVVSRLAAERWWPGGEPLGQRLRVGEGEAAEEYEVVGVVADLRSHGLAEEPAPTLYFDYHQRFHRRLCLLLRGRAGTPPVLTGPLGELLARHHPEMAVIDLVPFEEQVRRSLVLAKLMRDLALAFAAAALALALVGVVSVLAYSVARRRREMGLRRAVGATPGDVRRLVLAEAGRWLAAGTALGLAAAWPLSRLLDGFLFAVPAYDPASFAAVAALLAVTGFAAAWWPASRAARVEPATALRCD